ncbi:hypothetical protein TH63_16835 [Rufibacter radiotolerans]|uniref:Carboxypeptidase-like regulatory domain-containing protein n=1 Tax=Rufibacter radiotolerans TaxID=1379910 RepID=A0A0H4W8Z1_9BACT|nr:carboxypeptidase-like regulatory domain-containing protein [Rufibacter radiotolerans]AKQ46921.1 hypothetical protein TH63_16835 [Rufibacter radiotolerans]
MKHVFFLWGFCLLLSFSAFSQTKGTVTDKATGRPVAFANIWVENENLGTTSNEQGEFKLGQTSLEGKTLVISCLGYERTRVPVTGPTLPVVLVPSAVALSEVTVRKSAKRTKRVLNAIDNNTQYSFGSNGTPWIVAQHIPYIASFAATPFLDEVALVTMNNLKKAAFRIHLLRVGEKGEPTTPLLQTPLLVQAPQGIKTVRLDLSQYDLQMPAQGLFIAFEWLIIKQNRYEPTDPETGERLGPARISYEPSIRTYAPNSTGHSSWIYHQGQWVSTSQREGDAISFATPHFQLTLSN